MPVPATRGQLKTNLNEMRIGDYIVCSYKALTSGQVGTFYDLGGEIREEIPVEGSANPNGSFYFVKVDRGLLIADRVIQHSIPWSTLNASGFIQGFTNHIFPYSLTSRDAFSNMIWNNGNINFTKIAPNHLQFSGKSSSPGQVNYTISLSGRKHYFKYNINLLNLANGSSLAVFFTDNTTKTYRGIHYRNEKVYLYGSEDVEFCNLYEAVNVDVEFFADWVRGINILIINGRVYDDIPFDPGSGSSWISSDLLYVVCGTTSTAINSVKFDKFQTISDSGLNFSYTFGGKIRSLTGGVAYADANGNSSLTDQGYGGWPTNNEWDKYIVNFPQELIQEGKTLDDVFHWNGVASWCQDTPINGIIFSSGNNGRRIGRGYDGYKNIHVDSSSKVGTTWGFRPVLEYKEV